MNLKEVLFAFIKMIKNAIPDAIEELLTPIINIPKENPWIIAVMTAVIIILLLIQKKQKMKLRIPRIFKE